MRRAAGGGAELSQPVVRRLMAVAAATSPRQQQARESLESLSGRELEVARAIGEGRSNAEIAARLHLSVATVKAHVTAIFDKLEVTNRVQVAIVIHEANPDRTAPAEPRRRPVDARPQPQW